MAFVSLLPGRPRASQDRARQYTTDGRYPYHQVPLHPERGEIRLLRVDLTEVQPDTPLSCSFEILPLKIGSHGAVIDHNDSFSGYKAASYTWDVNPNTTSMLIDGHRVQVPQNTETALRGLLRHQLKGKNHTSYHNESSVRNQHAFLLWIDALCIDQENLTEKGHQVAVMGDVYSSADEVLIWLGDDDTSLGPELATLLNDIHADCARATQDFTELQDTLFPKDELGERRSVSRNIWSGNVVKHIMDAATFTPHQLGLLTEFYSLSWFSRVWIVQEVLLAKVATLHWGETSIPWPVGSLAGKWMNYGRNSLYSHGDMIFTGAVRRAMEPLFGVSALYMLSLEALRMLSDEPDAPERKLSSLLIQCGTFQATDPKDSVYALLGLLPARIRQILKDNDILMPDYTLDLGTVYTQATRAIMLTEDGSTSFLNGAGLHRASKPDNPALPSWVPRYGHSADGTDTVQFFDSYESTRFVPPAALPEQPPPPNVLRLKAHITHTVTTIGPQFPDMRNIEASQNKTFQQYISRLLQTWDLIKSTFDSLDPSHQPDLPMIALTLCCGRTTGNEEASAATDLLDQLLPLIEALRKYEPGDAIPMSVFPLFLAIGGNSVNRHFFVTSEGSFGMGPPGIQEGDRVAFIFGCVCPFLLRPVEDHWVLVGDVYLNDYMNKSHWKDLRDKSVLEEVVEWVDIH